MAFNLSFDARTVAPDVGPVVVPSGIYDVWITNTEEKLVKDGNGAAYIEITMEILSGDYKGKIVKDRLNHKNPNEQTRQIAYGQLSAYCYVTGIMVIQQSTAELHQKPFRINVAKVTRKDDPTKEGNEVRGYLDSQGYKPGENPGVGGAAQNAAAGGWGGAPQATQAQPDTTQGGWNPAATAAAPQAQAQPQAQPQATAAPAAQPAQTQAAPQASDMTQAIDPRVLEMLKLGLTVEQAQAALAVQAGANAATAAAIQPQPQTTAAPAGPTPESIAASAAALVAASLGSATQTQAAPQVETPPGVSETPDWALPPS